LMKVLSINNKIDLLLKFNKKNKNNYFMDLE